MSKSEDNPDMKVLKTATCKTLSGKSTLTYQIGINPDSIVHLRITQNTGAGYFSEEWVPYDDIQAALKDNSLGAAITSIRLPPCSRASPSTRPPFCWRP